MSSLFRMQLLLFTSWAVLSTNAFSVSYADTYTLLYPVYGREQTRGTTEKKFSLLSFLLNIKPVVEIQNESLESHEHSYVAPEISQSYMLQHET